MYIELLINFIIITAKFKLAKQTYTFPELVINASKQRNTARSSQIN